MGRAVLRAALKDKTCDVCAALVRSDSEFAGEPLARRSAATRPTSSSRQRWTPTRSPT